VHIGAAMSITLTFEKQAAVICWHGMHLARRSSPEIAGEVLNELADHLYSSGPEQRERHRPKEQSYEDILPAHMPATVSLIEEPGSRATRSLRRMAVNSKQVRLWNPVGGPAARTGRKYSNHYPLQFRDWFL
jgi:hypothetical protein